MRFVRGTARNRTWCELEHRPLDWASRSLKREFEEVIVVVDAEVNETNKTTPGSERKVCSKKGFDRSGRVRDVRLPEIRSWTNLGG
jgi:hypothetical protein